MHKTALARWLLTGLCSAGCGIVAGAEEPQVIDIAEQLELMLDDYLIERMDGVKHKLHEPRPTPLSDAPPSGGYATVIHGGDLYRLWHRGRISGYVGIRNDGNLGEMTCYTKSRDGIHWEKPLLGIVEINGSKENNVILAHQPPFSHNFTPFLDTRPDVPDDERYKAVAGVMVPVPGVREGGGLEVFASPDGIHWRKLSDGR